MYVCCNSIGLPAYRKHSRFLQIIFTHLFFIGPILRQYKWKIMPKSQSFFIRHFYKVELKFAQNKKSFVSISWWAFVRNGKRERERMRYFKNVIVRFNIHMRWRCTMALFEFYCYGEKHFVQRLWFRFICALHVCVCVWMSSRHSSVPTTDALFGHSMHESESLNNLFSFWGAQ